MVVVVVVVVVQLDGVYHRLRLRQADGLLLMLAAVAMVMVGVGVLVDRGGGDSAAVADALGACRCSRTQHAVVFFIRFVVVRRRSRSSSSIW